MKSRRLWIVWEHQRRSQVLAEHFGCTLHEIIHEGLLRYPRSIWHTLRILVRGTPSTVFVQNPSMILAALAVAWGVIARVPVIVDRHSTFLLNRSYALTPWLLLFKTLSRLTVRYADLTIVTNQFLADLVQQYGGVPFVLPDKLPGAFGVPHEEYPVSSCSRNILFVSSFAADEPLAELLEAVALVRDRTVRVYVTGKLENAPQNLVKSAPSNVEFTDYLSDRDYLRLMRSVDIVVVLTSADHTMLCGCYEAVAAERPLITSERTVLRSYFPAALFVDNSPIQIAAALDISEGQLEACRLGVRDMKRSIAATWIAESNKLDGALAAARRPHV